MKGTAFITGATSGFGEAIARALSREGYKIVALARRKERLETLTSSSPISAIKRRFLTAWQIYRMIFAISKCS